MPRFVDRHMLILVKILLVGNTINKYAIYAAILLTVLGSMALRTAPKEHFLRHDGGVDFYAGDTYDHMRRVHLIVQNFPSLPSHNFYQGYPVGSPYLLAPGFDLMIASADKERRCVVEG
ncbi:MAG: hypothetical protein KAR83_03715 [Thermodesulfovibrionales bacterium]|nr:hypothetical protein [Thermodesulfovibrionales bacterium]